MSDQQNPQAAFEQSVKALGAWLAFLKTREGEYTLQMERAKKAAAPSEIADAPIVQIEQDGQQETGMDLLLPGDPNDTEKHEAWL